MIDDALHASPPVSHAALESAAAVACCRFGDAEGEARRRGRVTALVRAAEELSRKLHDFAQVIGPHARGVHNNPDCLTEVDALADALGTWTFSVNAAAELRADCVS